MVDVAWICMPPRLQSEWPMGKYNLVLCSQIIRSYYKIPININKIIVTVIGYSNDLNNDIELGMEVHRVEVYGLQLRKLLSISKRSIMWMSASAAAVGG